MQSVGTADNPSGCEYIISNIDSVELLLMYNSSCEHFATTGVRVGFVDCPCFPKGAVLFLCVFMLMNDMTV